jgi:FlaA1/EpsC-like NDP-sugar epimerase
MMVSSYPNKLKDKTILITGELGSIGSEIVRQVLQFNPKRVIILDWVEHSLHSLSLRNAPEVSG